MTDDVFGPAVLDPSLPHNQPGLKAALTALWQAEKTRSRSTSIHFVGGPTIRVMVYEHDAAKTKVLEAWSFDLPTLIRGQLVASTEAWAVVETAAPIQKSEVDWRPEAAKPVKP